MKAPILSSDEVSYFEREVDQFFASLSIPGRSKFEARWMALTAVEDVLRLIWAQQASSWANPSDFSTRAELVIRLDHYKYCLKYTLEIISNIKEDQLSGTFKLFGSNGGEYLQINSLINFDSSKYADAVGVFAGYHSGHQDLHGSIKERYMEPEKSEIEIRFAALEPLLAQNDPVFSPMPILGVLFLGYGYVNPITMDEYRWGETTSFIVNSVRSKGDRVKYQYVAIRARELAEEFDHDPEILPKEWNFPWGSREEVIRFAVGLITMCVYHLIAIFFGSARLGVKGNGINDVGIILKRKELASRISITGGLSIEKCELIVRSLTYGYKVDTPDPALQPFISVDSDLLFVPCMNVISNNWARNSLALHARVDPASFNKQSHVFETKMTSDIKAIIKDKYEVFYNKSWRSSKIREEVDILLIDRGAKLVILCELKWSIPPGDPRELYNRRKAIDDKIVQVRRKISAFEAASGTILKVLDIDLSDGWTISGVVVSGGYGGHPSRDDSIPIVPQGIFEEFLTGSVPLSRINKALLSSDWLPAVGVDIDIEHKIDKIGSIEIRDTGFSMKRGSYVIDTLRPYIKAISI